MAVTLLKKPKLAPVVATTPSEIELLIDEIGAELDAQEAKAAQIKKLTAEHELYKAKLKKLQQLVAEVDDLDPDATWEVKGADFRAELGKQGTTRAVKDIKKLQELMGDAVFYGACTVPMKAIDDYLNPQERAQVLEITRGVRSVKITRRRDAL